MNLEQQLRKALFENICSKYERNTGKCRQTGDICKYNGMLDANPFGYWCMQYKTPQKPDRNLNV